MGSWLYLLACGKFPLAWSHSIYCISNAYGWMFFTHSAPAACVVSASREGVIIQPRQNADASNVALRIMPLGASVTFGVGSTTGDSYRKALHDSLSTNGRQVEMVGTVKHGDFAQNSCEAFSGFVINQLVQRADQATPQFKPNLILIDAGTNNCNKGGTVPDAGRNISSLINRMFQQSPGVTIVLTTILVNPNKNQDACRVNINQQYQTIAQDFQRQGARFVLVDMRGPDGPTVNDLADGRHPNDNGYTKMAAVWAKGIQQAQTSNFLRAAVDVSSESQVPAQLNTDATYGSKNATKTNKPGPIVTSSAVSSRLQIATMVLVSSLAGFIFTFC